MESAGGGSSAVFLFAENIRGANPDPGKADQNMPAKGIGRSAAHFS